MRRWSTGFALGALCGWALASALLGVSRVEDIIEKFVIEQVAAHGHGSGVKVK